MLQRREVFPNVIEMNYQARQRLGCCVYLVFDKDEWMLIDIGYEEIVDDVVETIQELGTENTFDAFHHTSFHVLVRSILGRFGKAK